MNDCSIHGYICFPMKAKKEAPSNGALPRRPTASPVPLIFCGIDDGLGVLPPITSN